MMKCNVQHPTLSGVRCDHKRQHKGWHSANGVEPGAHGVKPDVHLYCWAKGRGRNRANGTWSHYVS